HGAAGPLVAVGAQAPEDGHALDRLALVGALALVAGRVGAAVRLQDLDDLALQGAVLGLGDLDDGLHLAGLVVDGLPAADRAVGGPGAGRGQRQHGGCGDCDERVLHVRTSGAGWWFRYRRVGTGTRCPGSWAILACGQPPSSRGHPDAPPRGPPPPGTG